MLPGLAPHHTRKSLYHAKYPDSSGSRLMVERIVSNVDDFIISPNTGLWLLPKHVAEQDAEQTAKRAEYLAGIPIAERPFASKQAQTLRTISKTLCRSNVNSVGCIEGGLRGKQTPAKAVIDIANLETGTLALNTESEIPSVSACGNPDCYNSRHHNLDFGGTGQTSRLVELNPNWYKTDQTGHIETIWGDYLPPVLESLRYLQDFLARNYPYVPIELSPLTATPLSQIALHPLTGCWEVYKYETNTSGLKNIKNGYGVMYSRVVMQEIDKATGEIIKGFRRGSVLAHNLVWTATGHNLDKDLERNHLCNYTRCCNPLHIEQITPDENRSHGHRARATIRKQELNRPETVGAFMPKFDLRLLLDQLHNY